TSKITCESCHTDRPHKLNEKANDHTDKVACQSCHIPSFARVNPTKVRWDWSTAGKLKDGKPYGIKDEFGQYSYMTKKGTMLWEKNVQPEYLWYNGSIKHITVKDTIDPASVVKISHPVGSADDKNSRIFPFKLHTGKQPYDKINKRLVIMNIFAENKEDKNAFWKSFKFDKAISEGMEYVNLPYSGEFDFVETSYAFPTTHMVAPKENVVGCIECHTRKDGRMAKISGVFIPGRDNSDVVNNIGLLVIFGTLGVIILHAIGRIVAGKNGKKEA
ncbi:cytochrome C, partial [bacterium]|nr:cytochrome C [bacterium]